MRPAGLARPGYASVSHTVSIADPKLVRHRRSVREQDEPRQTSTTKITKTTSTGTSQVHGYGSCRRDCCDSSASAQVKGRLSIPAVTSRPTVRRFVAVLSPLTLEGGGEAR
jgi:hypothetical protein